MNGVLFFRNRYYINPQSVLKSSLLHEFHATLVASHVGVKKTLVCLASFFFWPRMRLDVETFVASCVMCQQTKYSTQPPTRPLQPIPTPSLVWNEVTIDFIIGLPPSHDYTVIIVIVDCLTKSAHFGPLPTDFTSARCDAPKPRGPLTNHQPAEFL